MKRARLAVCAILLAAFAAAAVAQEHPNQQKGFNPGQVYQLEGIDNINGFNGNLIITIPLGQKYKGNGNLSYGLTLVYNANVWDYSDDGNHLITTPNDKDNAGLGWRVSLGRLLPPSDRSNSTRGSNKLAKAFIYDAPDGSDHKFGPESLFETQQYVTTEEARYDSPGSPIPDGANLRMSKTGNYNRTVEFPDGTIQSFEDFAHGAPGKKEDWRLTRIADRFHNFLDVSYENDGLTWKLQETGTTRIHYLKFTRLKPPYVTFATDVLTQVQVAKFGGGTANYDFAYADDPIRHNGYYPLIAKPGNDQSGPGGVIGNVRVPLLTSLTLPSGEQYLMTKSNGELAYFKEGFESGLLSRLTLPTGASIDYTWTTVNFTIMSGRSGPRYALGSDFGSWPTPGGGLCSTDPFAVEDICDDRGNPLPDLRLPTVTAKARSKAQGVATRTVTERNGTTRVWNYTHKLAPADNCTEMVDIDAFNSALVFYRSPRQKATIIQAPDGTTTVSYFAITWNQTQCGDTPATTLWEGTQYGRPITRYISVGSDSDPYGKKSLSTRTYTGAVTLGPPTNSGPEKWSAVSGGTLLRSHYLAFDNVLVQRTEAASRTVLEDTDCATSVKCYAEEYRFGFDEFGHHKQVSTTGNLPDQRYRTTFTNYSGKPATNEWVLDTFTEQCSRDEGQARLAAVSDCKALLQGATAQEWGSYTRFCFNRPTGFLNAKRTLKGPFVAPSTYLNAADVLTVYVPEDNPNVPGSSSGNIKEEKTYGGDTQALSTTEGDACAVTTSPAGSPVYWTRFTYDSGAVATVKPLVTDSRPDPIGYNTIDNTIDPSTGLVSVSTEPSGVAMRYQYDGSGRLTDVAVVDNDPSHVAAHTEYTYQKASGTATRAMVTAEQKSGTTALTRQQYVFDDLGRLTREIRATSSGTDAVRETLYDAAGRKEKVSEWEAAPAHYTVFGYDALGRLTSAVGPDGATTTYTYTGDHRKQRKVKRSETSSIWTTEEYDSLGHLLHVFGPREAENGTNELEAYYGYDAADRLISVQLKDAAHALLQSRSFSYDGRGFLLAETHPENGTTTYGDYDPRGHAGSKVLAPGGTKFDQLMHYDAAERLVKVESRNPANGQFRSLRVFTFGTQNENDPDVNKLNREKGKLATATRFNYAETGAPGADLITVTTSYAYYDAAGRIGAKKTAFSDGPTFRQSFTYDDAGQPKQLTFPTCLTGCGTVSLPDERPTDLTWNKGELKNIAGFAGPIDYHLNGMVKQLPHATTRPITDIVDIDPANAMARPKEIKVTGFCTGPAVTATLPADAPVFPGGVATLLAPPEGVKYQWYNAATGAKIGPEKTVRDFATSPLFETTSYFVRVFGADGCFTDSRIATVTLQQCSQLQVQSFTVPHLVVKDDPAPMTVAVSAPAGAKLLYRWRLITDGPNGPVETFVDTETGQYSPAISVNTRVQVAISSGTQCAVVTTIEQIRVCEPPAIVTQPHSASAAPPPAGQSVTLSTTVAARGENVRFRWHERTSNGVRELDSDTTVQGIDTDTLTVTFTGVQLRTFFVTVYDNESPGGCQGSVDSADVLLAVAECVKLITQPANLWVYENSAPVPLVAELEVQQLADYGVNPYRITVTWYYGSGTAFNEQVFEIPTSNPAEIKLYRSTGMVFVNQPYQTYWCRIVSNRPGCTNTLYSKKVFVARWGSCPLPPVSVTPKQAVVSLNAHATFTVACDWPRVTYQWYEGQSGDTHKKVDGATSNKLTVPSTVLSYWCRVTDECGLQHRDTETVTVARNGTTICAPPFIGQQPQSVDVAVGQQATLSIDASGPGLTYEWWAVGGGMVGTGRTFTAPAASRTYYVKIFSTCATNAVESAYAAVRVATCPTINVTQQPLVQLVNGVRQLSVAATSTTGSTVSYQWYKGVLGDPTTPAGTGAVITINPTETTSYWVHIATPECAVDGVPVEAVPCAPLSFVPPAGGSIVWGQTFLLESPRVSGTGLTYKWHQGSANGPVVGTSPGVWVQPLDTTAYVFEVNDACGNQAFSSPITVLVCTAPAFETQPQNTRIFNGKTAAFSVKATESQQTPVEYRLYQVTAVGPSPVGASVPANGGVVTLTSGAVTADTQFFVRATAGSCSTDSNTVTAFMCTQSEVVGIASSTDATAGQTVHLRAGASDQADSSNVFAWYCGESGTAVACPGASSITTLKTSNENWVNVTATSPTTGDLMTVKYFAWVTNLDGCISRTPTFTIRVCKPTITQQPVGDMIDPGGSKTLSVVANTPGLSYQWYIGDTPGTGAPISGATSSSVTVSPTVATSYWVLVTGICGNVNSVATQVTICQPPSIAWAAATQSTIAKGSSTTLSVSATGTNLTYQWYTSPRGVTTAPVSGATSASISVSPQDTTTYWVRVSGRCGTADSQTVTVTVCATPQINVPPQSVSIYSGNTATLTVSATAQTSVPITYQWYRGSAPDTTQPIAGATSASYTTPALTVPNSYWVRISSSSCTPADSATATVSICPYQQTIAGPADVQTTVGQTARLTTVPDAGSNQYRWYRVVSGGSPVLIAGPSSTNYVDVAPTVTTQYYATITTGTCLTTTTNTTVNVCVPTFTQQPQSAVTITIGNSTDLTAAANTAGVTYQWYSGSTGNWVLISGATSATYHATPSVTTTYMVRATGYCGRTTDSTPSTVTVCTPPAISTQPANTAAVNANMTAVTMSVTATGTGLTYQWYIGERSDTSQPVSGATSASLTRTPSSTLKYWVRVSGTCGTLDSNTAYMSVYPTITTNLTSFSVRSGSTAPLKVVGSGNYLHYTWKWSSNNQPISGAPDAPYYSLLNVTSPTGVRCDVTSGIATVTSNTASIDLCDGTGITIGVSGTGSCRTLTAYYDPYAAESYTWYKGDRGDNSQPVGTGQSISVCPASSTKYWVVASTTDIFTGVTCYSDAAAVTVP